MYPELRNKEFGIINLLKSGWQVFKNKFFPILIIALLINFPLNIVTEVARLSGADWALTLSIQFQSAGFLGLLSNVAVMVITEQDVLGKKVTAWSALKKAYFRWRSAFVTSLTVGIFSLFLLLLLIIPGIIFIVNTAFFLHAVGLRNLGWRAALDYSRNLVKDSFWRVFYTFLVIHLIVFLFPSMILGVLIGTISSLTGEGSNWVSFTNLVTLFFSQLISYLYIVTGTVFFLNMDYRKSLKN